MSKLRRTKTALKSRRSACRRLPRTGPYNSRTMNSESKETCEANRKENNKRCEKDSEAHIQSRQEDRKRDRKGCQRNHPYGRWSSSRAKLSLAPPRGTSCSPLAGSPRIFDGIVSFNKPLC
jgi:hypothetical protein